MRKRLREIEDEELLQEAKKVKVQEEMSWTLPSDTEIWKWREQKGRLPLADEDVYNKKDTDNYEIYPHRKNKIEYRIKKKKGKKGKRK